KTYQKEQRPCNPRGAPCAPWVADYDRGYATFVTRPALYRGMYPTFKGSACPCRFFVLMARHTTRSRAPAPHRPTSERVRHPRAARPLDDLSIIGRRPREQAGCEGRGER